MDALIEWKIPSVLGVSRFKVKVTITQSITRKCFGLQSLDFVGRFVMAGRWPLLISRSKVKVSVTLTKEKLSNQ